MQLLNLKLFFLVMTIQYNIIASEAVTLMKDQNRLFFNENGRENLVDADTGSELVELQEKFSFPSFKSTSVEKTIRQMEEIMNNPQRDKESSLNHHEYESLKKPDESGEERESSDEYDLGPAEDIGPSRVEIIRRCIENDSQGNDPASRLITATMTSIHNDIDKYLRKKFKHLEL